MNTSPLLADLGVDDWAKRKGRSYGTILVDLERRRPVDLLPERQAETLAAWLKAHTGVEIVTRDRSRAYAEGITDGAPHALQVADRFHLLKNLSEALERLLTRQHQFVRAAVQPPTMPPQPSPPVQPQVEPPAILQPTFLPPLRLRPGVAERRDSSLALYNEVVRLKREGLSTEEVAPRVGKCRRTIYRWLSLGEFRELRITAAVCLILTFHTLAPGGRKAAARSRSCGVSLWSGATVARVNRSTTICIARPPRLRRDSFKVERVVKLNVRRR